MNDRKRTRWLFVASFASLLGLFWLLRGNRVPEPNPPGAPQASASQAARPTHPTSNPATEFPPEMASAETPFPMAPPTPEKLQDVLDKYKAFAVYPPWSRPHNESTKYKLTWNEPVVSKLRFSDKVANDPINYKFASDRAHVLPGQALTSWFSAFHGDDENKRVPVKVVEAWVMITSGPTTGRAVKLTYADDGTNGDVAAGDLIYTASFVPSTYPELKKTQSAQISVNIEVDGIQKPIVRDFTYSPRDVLGFGDVTDSARGGSLAVDVAVDVKDPGEYTCEANLMSGDGATAIGYAKEKPTWPAGPARLGFTFFGKVVHDSWLDGPYLVRDIRCVLRQSGDEENVWAADDRVHRTKAYLIDDFSDAEWKAPEKTQRISMLEKLLDQAKSGVNPDPNAPRHIHVGPDGKEQVIVGPR